MSLRRRIEVAFARRRLPEGDDAGSWVSRDSRSAGTSVAEPDKMPIAVISDATSQGIRAISVIVRDVVRKSRHELPGNRPMLRVPYDLLQPQGPIVYRDEMIIYSQRGERCLGRVAPAPLADARAGERVLVRLPSSEDEGEWWLCEVEEVAR